MNYPVDKDFDATRQFMQEKHQENMVTIEDARSKTEALYEKNKQELNLIHDQQERENAQEKNHLDNTVSQYHIALSKQQKVFDERMEDRYEQLNVQKAEHEKKIKEDQAKREAEHQKQKEELLKMEEELQRREKKKSTNQNSTNSTMSSFDSTQNVSIAPSGFGSGFGQDFGKPLGENSNHHFTQSSNNHNSGFGSGFGQDFGKPSGHDDTGFGANYGKNSNQPLKPHENNLGSIFEHELEDAENEDSILKQRTKSKQKHSGKHSKKTNDNYNECIVS